MGWDNPGGGGGGGGGAPTDADYVTFSANATLTNEKVLGTDTIMAGTLAARPAAATAGRMYFATDTGELFRDTGAVWVIVNRTIGPRVYFAAMLGGYTWANMPAALTEFDGFPFTRNRVDLDKVSQARFGVQVRINGAAGSELLLRASADDTSANFAELAATAGAGDVNINVTNTTQLTGWFDIAAAHKAADRRVSVWGQGGDGIADPQIGVMFMEVR